MQLEHVILVGHGKMGSAMLTRWREQSCAAHIDIVSPNHTQNDIDTCHWHRNLASLKARATHPIIIFAVKPATLESVLKEYAEYFKNHAPIYISVAAGKELAFYHRHLGNHATVIRAMPNTPAQIGQGMTLLCTNAHTPQSARDAAQLLMQSLGKSSWLNDEVQMDAAMALSGCGPAYLFTFIDSMIQAGIKNGLSEQQARELTLQTAIGTIALLKQTGQSALELTAQVASPGGATQAALEQLTASNAQEALLLKAVNAAIKRAKELA